MSVWAVIGQSLSAVGGATGVGAMVRVAVDHRGRRAQAQAAEAEAEESQADAAEAVTKSAMMLLRPLQAELEKTRTALVASNVALDASNLAVSQLRGDVARLHIYIGDLIQVIEGAGLPMPNRPAYRHVPTEPIMNPEVDHESETS